MIPLRLATARWISSLAGIALAACGGSDDAFSVSSTSLTYETRVDDLTAKPPLTVRVTVNHGPVYFTGDFDKGPGSPILAVGVTIDSDKTGTVNIFMRQGFDLGPGTHVGKLTIIGCANPDCTAQVRGSPKTVTVTAQVTPAPPHIDAPQSVGFFTVLGGPLPAPETSFLTTGFSGTVQYTVTVAYQDAATGWLTVPSSGTAPGTLSVSVNTTAVAPGIHTAFVDLAPAGGTGIARMQVSFTVLDGLAASPTQVALAFGPNAISQQSIAVSRVGAASVAWTAHPLVPWLKATPASGAADGSFTVAVDPTGLLSLTPGNYAGDLALEYTAGSAAGALDVHVSLAYSGPVLQLGATGVDFAVSAGSLAADLHRIVAVSASPAEPVSWTAAATVPWVSVSPSSGAAGTTVSIDLVASALQSLATGPYAGEIVFSYSSAGAPGTVRLPLRLAYVVPSVQFVAPHVALTGSVDPVVVRGSGFTGAIADRVLFDGTPATAIRVVSDTELRATPPVLAAGAHAVTVGNGAGAHLTRASLSVVDPVTPAYAALPSPGPVSKIVYDAERTAIVVANKGGVIERYKFDPAAAVPWTASTGILPGGLQDFALAPDGSEITALSPSTVFSVDPITLAASPSAAPFSVNDAANRIEYANDGRATILTQFGGTNSTRSYLYDLRAGSASANLVSFTAGMMGAAGDGSRIVIGSQQLSPADTVFVFEASTDQYLPTVLAAPDLNGRDVRAVAIDRTGARIAIDSFGDVEIFDADFNTIGFLPPTSAAFVLTADGKRAVTFDAVIPPDGGPPATKVRTFDLTASVADTGGTFPEIGTGIVPPDNPGAGVVLAISPDGGTLFLAGDRAVLVVPLP